MHAVDMHTHTSHYSPCGHQTFDELVQVAVKCGLETICITEHHFRWPDEALAEALEKTGLAGKLTVLAGEEVACRSNNGRRQGDYLVFGLEESIGQPMDVRELIDMVHARGGIVVAAHPFREGYGSAEIVCELEVDAIEVYNKAHTPDGERRAWECAQRRGLPAVGNSDAHRPDEVGRYLTYFEGPVRSLEDLVQQVRARKVHVPAPGSLTSAAGA